MKQEVLITVHSTFRAGGEVEKTEFFTNGLLYLKNKKYYLLYEMYDQEQPAGKTSIIVENPHKVSLRTQGESYYCLSLDQGVRCQGWFHFSEGRMMLGIHPTKIEADLTEQGGIIRMRYGLESGGMLLTENEIEIDVKVK